MADRWPQTDQQLPVNTVIWNNLGKFGNRFLKMQFLLSTLIFKNAIFWILRYFNVLKLHLKSLFQNFPKLFKIAVLIGEITPV